MDWLKETLKKLGIEESQIEKIDTEVRKELPLHFVPKSQYNEINEIKKRLETDIGERDKQIETLGKSAGLSDALKQELAKVQEENKLAKEQYETEKQELKLSTALKLALGNSVHDVDMVAGLLDKSTIELGEDGSIKKGYEDQIKTLRESKSFLFVPEKESKPIFAGFTPAGSKDKNDPPSSVGASFAQTANQGSQPSAAVKNPWGDGKE